MFVTIAAILFGLIIGSFLSVCIYRIPAARDDFEGETIFGQLDKSKGFGLNTPRRSICPKCKQQLKWHHNIPVLSWMMLGGKCAFCSERIPVRYPVVELLSALSAVLSVSVYGLTPTGFLIYVFVAVLIVISFIDIDFYIIPNAISLPGTVIGFGFALLNQFTGWFQFPVVPDVKEAFWGVLAGAGFLWLVAEFYLRIRKIEGLGMGDVKLLAMTGAFFGLPGSFYTIFLGSILGSVGGVLMILVFGRKMSQHLPFGPYLSLGTAIYLFSGTAILDWWIKALQ